MDTVKFCAKFLFFLLSIICIGCGGGSDDSSGGGSTPAPAPDVPNTVTYQMGTTSNPLVATLQPGGLTFTLTSINLGGTLNRDTGDLTVAENRSMVFTLSPSPFIEEETLTVGILTPSGSGGIVSPGNQQYPSSGVLQINVTSGVTDDFDRVVGEILLTGVRIQPFKGVNSIAEPTELSWAEFEALETDAGAAQYLRVARYAYNALEFVFEQFSLSYLLLSTIVDYEDLLQSNGSIIGNSKIFPGTGSAGTLRIDWLDASGNGDLGPADNFFGTFTQFWIDDPTDDIDRMYNGELGLLGYIETQNSAGGNLVFDNFTLRETEGNTISPDTTTINGGFSLLFSW
jgi:hypothetical protein